MISPCPHTLPDGWAHLFASSGCATLPPLPASTTVSTSCSGWGNAATLSNSDEPGGQANQWDTCPRSRSSALSASACGGVDCRSVATWSGDRDLRSYSRPEGEDGRKMIQVVVPCA